MKKNHIIFNSCQVLGKVGAVVYQRVKPGLGNVASDPSMTLQVRRHVPTNTSNTPAQQARRARFANAVAAWHALDTATKQDYNQRANRQRVTGYNLFISERLRYS